MFDADDAAHCTFVRLHRKDGQQLVLSRAAMHLHTFGVLSSIDDGNAGFIADSYLNEIRTETSVTALELCLIGLWERVPCGYRVMDADAMAVTAQITEQLHLLALQCEQAGGHVTEQDQPQLCARCGTPLDNVVIWRRPAPPNAA